ncbi:amidohydrolase family protein [Fangia hongkongensis]|uniref:amidohydrolase family protein n=1 Tax=Fangia hongkongensis TaxID=270495 RepID=UPI0003611C90|nr:amidohydrolase family protein [Fangia hongkongensis]MBK2124750.1 amidohydrolase family protein [Fangia hongkongensis]
MHTNNGEIIDSHFHIWDSTKLPMPWLELFKDTLRPIYTLNDYISAIHNSNIVQSVYMEVDTAHDHQKMEADLAIALCNNNTQVAAAGIGCDLASSDFPEYIQHYAKNSNIKSVRHNFFASDPKITTEENFIKNTQLLGQLNIMCDLIMPVDDMHYGITLASLCPNTTFIIDHCGACPPKADSQTWDKWSLGIQNYAALNNVICKISECGFMQADYQWAIEDMSPIIQHCFHAFGKDRVIYGSNWPVCELTGTVEKWISAIHKSLEGVSKQDLHKLFYLNAKHYYSLP